MGVEDGAPESTTNGSSSDETSDFEAKIIRQVEYYFGDCNLVSDKFMQQQLKLDDGWIPLEVLVKFNRLKTLSTDYEAIVKALKKSTNKLIEISEDELKLRRDPEKPLPEKNTTNMEELQSRSVYLKGFPLDTTLDQMMEFFQDKGKVLKIYMRKKPQSSKFKGSIFLTFGTKEEVHEFMKIDSLKFHNKELLKELSTDYHVRKEIEYKKRKEDQAKRKQEREEKKEQTSQDDEIEEDSGSAVEVKGSILKLNGLGETTGWDEIRRLFEKYADIGFVDHSKGQEEAIVRFKKEGDAQKALDAVLKDGHGSKKTSDAEKKDDKEAVKVEGDAEKKSDATEDKKVIPEVKEDDDGEKPAKKIKLEEPEKTPKDEKVEEQENGETKGQETEDKTKVKTEDSDSNIVLIRGKEVKMQVLVGDEEEAYWKKFRNVRKELKMRNRGRHSSYRGGRGRGGYRGDPYRRSHVRDRDRSGPSAKVARTD